MINVRKKLSSTLNHSLTRKLQTIIIPMLVSVFVIKSEPNRSFGSSNKRRIRFAEGNVFVFIRLMSLNDNENKATSAPDTIKEIKSNISKTKTSIVRTVWGSIAKLTGENFIWSRKLIMPVFKGSRLVKKSSHHFNHKGRSYWPA